MKKFMMLLAVSMAALLGQSAVVDWKYTSTAAADADKTVYVLLGDTAVTQWESLEVLQKAAVNSGVIGKSGRNYLTSGKASGDNITASGTSLYYVIVDKAGETFDVTSVADVTSYVYDPGAQQTSPGSFTGLSPASITSAGNKFGGDPTPEPTSGLLLVLGVAGLALRRKQA